MPFYVAPEQVMKDRADYARKGIARGRSLVAVRLRRRHPLVAENPSNTLRKVSEIYDRIAFAGVGKYNEFDQLRIAGVRHADLKGYSFSREDVDAREPGQPVRADPRPGLHPRDEADGGRDPRRRGRPRRRPTTSCSTSSTTAPSWTRRASACSAARPRPSPNGPRARGGRASTSPPRSRLRSPRWPAPSARSAPTSSRWPCWRAATGGAPSVASTRRDRTPARVGRAAGGPAGPGHRRRDLERAAGGRCRRHGRHHRPLAGPPDRSRYPQPAQGAGLATSRLQATNRRSSSAEANASRPMAATRSTTARR